MIVKQPPLGTPLNKSHPLAKGLVGCWLLNEGGGQIAINSANVSNPGTLTSGTIFKAASNGQCATFDATNDYIPCANNASITTYPVTLSCWFQMTASLAGDAIFVSVVNTAALDEFWIGWHNSIGLRTVAQSDGASVNRYKTLSIPSFPADTKWHHAVGVFTDSSTQNIYIDGFDRGGGYSTAGSGLPSPTNLNKASIGGFIYNGSTFYSASATRNIMDVKIYNRVLSATEVRQLYTNPYQMFKESRVKRFKEVEIVNRFKFNNSGVRPRPFAPGLAR